MGCSDGVPHPLGRIAPPWLAPPSPSASEGALLPNGSSESTTLSVRLRALRSASASSRWPRSGYEKGAPELAPPRRARTAVNAAPDAGGSEGGWEVEAKAKSDQLATHLHTPSPRLRNRRHRQQPSLQTPATRTSRTPRMHDNKTCAQIHAICSKPKNTPQHTTNPPPSGVGTAAALPFPVGTTTITCTDLEAADRARVCDVELSDRLTGEDWGRASPLRRTASVAAVTGTAARVLPDGA